MGDSTFEKTFNNIDRVVYSTERITQVLEESPELLKDLQQSTLAEVNRQLLVTLSTLSNERAIVLEALTAERVAIMQEIYNQRIETLDRIDTLAYTTINQSTLFASDVIDKLFWRVLIILALVFVGGLVAIKFMKKR
jgi:3-methyladenine DNA glycosylase AlkD